MVYGFTFKEIPKVNRPRSVKKAWGNYVVAASRPEYSLTRFYLKKGGLQPLHYYLKTEGTLYVEEGSVLLKVIDKKGKPAALKLNKGDVFRLTPGLSHALGGLEESYVYMFSNTSGNNDYCQVESDEEALKVKLSSDKLQTADNAGEFQIDRPFDYRDKYWGSIQSVVNEAYTGKRIYLKAGAQNSLEFHCHKIETYFVHSGKMKAGLRLGRGENKSVIMESGDAFEIVPGLMHMRIGLEDSVIMEISTHDEDSDSHIVEDGRKYKHEET